MIVRTELGDVRTFKVAGYHTGRFSESAISVWYSSPYRPLFRNILSEYHTKKKKSIFF